MKNIVFFLLLVTIKTFSQELALIRENDKFGYINKIGEEVIKPQFDKANSFSDGLASVYINGKWGYINSEGKWVIEPTYIKANNFNSKAALVYLNKKWNYINKEGKTIELERKINKYYPFKEGVAFFREGKKVGLLNTEGKVILEPTYAIIRKFKNGFAKVLKNKLWGVINLKGEIVVPVEYDKIGGYTNGVTWGEKNKKQGLVVEGVFKPINNVSKIWDFRGDSDITYARVDKKIGFINKKGEWVIKPSFKKAKAFNNGMAPVFNKDKWGYIDSKGELVIDYQFKDAEIFSNDGLAPVKQKKWRFINTKGEQVIPFKYIITPGFSFNKKIEKGFINGLARVKDNTGWGFLKKDGSFLGNKTYQNAELFVRVKE